MLPRDGALSSSYADIWFNDGAVRLKAGDCLIVGMKKEYLYINETGDISEIWKNGLGLVQHHSTDCMVPLWLWCDTQAWG